MLQSLPRFLGALLAFLVATPLPALELVPMLGDHMVVQHDRPLRLWGTAEPTARVTATVHETGATAATNAGLDGKWGLQMAPLKAGGPYTITVVSRAATVTLNDVLAGEVWLCSGQSNMEWSVARSNGADATLAAPGPAHVRLFEVARNPEVEPADTLPGQWTTATTDAVAGFSAIGYYFGREIAQTQEMPVGLIDSTWGGTRIEPWMPRRTLARFPHLADELARTSDPEFARLMENAMDLQAHWNQLHPMTDPGNRGVLLGWHLPVIDVDDWETMELPAILEDAGHHYDGAFWFRRTVELPEELIGQELMLHLGAIDDFDETWVNGTRVGATGPETVSAHAVRRAYPIPAELATSPLTVAVRMFDHYGNGGFTSTAEHLALTTADGTERVFLAGPWSWRAEIAVIDPLHAIQGLLAPQTYPGSLYNGMIHPWTRYPLRGVLWYQGESNAGGQSAVHYRELFPAMISAWRERWNLGDLPFYYVQLANYRSLQTEPVEAGWGLIREAQQYALDLPAVHEAVILDVGEADDIHPRDKHTPAHRLARHARAEVYGEDDLAHESPRLTSWRVEGTRMLLDFAHVADGLTTRDEEAPRGFALRGATAPWHWAEITLVDADTIALSHPEITTPVAARYAWASNPVGNLMNGAGLPMAPFRTDRDADE